MEVFKLFGSILIDSAEAEASLSKTEGSASKVATTLGNGIKTAAKWTAGLVAGATAVGGAMVSAAKETASNLDVIDKASIRMGITAESYQELAYAAGLSGVEVSKLEQAAKKLQGTDLSLDEAIAQLQGIEDEGERSAAAVELFGKTAYDLTPLLNAGTEGMAAMKQEANDLGLVMSQDSVSAGAAMNDMFSKLEQTFGQVKNSIMVELMPYVMMILEWCIANLPLVADTVKKVMDRIMPIVQPILESVMALFKAAFALINGDTEAFGEEFKRIWEGLATAAVTLGQNILTGLWNGLKSSWTAVSSWLTEKANWIADKLTFWDNAQEGMSTSSGSTRYAHASGLAYVPYDNYPANLHRGEVVLNSQQGSDLLGGIQSAMAAAVNGFAMMQSGPSSMEGVITLKAEDGTSLGRYLVPFIRTENKSNPEVVGDLS